MAAYVYLTHRLIRKCILMSFYLINPIIGRVDCTSGHLDKGQKKIDTYRQEHKCNSLCRLLKLDKEIDKVQVSKEIGTQGHPLRIGFD